MLINLNDTEAKFCLYAVREMAAKLEAKLTTEAKTVSVLELLKPDTPRLTKSGKPAKKPGRKPKAVKQTIIEQKAA